MLLLIKWYTLVRSESYNNVRIYIAPNPCFRNMLISLHYYPGQWINVHSFHRLSSLRSITPKLPVKALEGFTFTIPSLPTGYPFTAGWTGAV